MKNCLSYSGSVAILFAYGLFTGCGSQATPAATQRPAHADAAATDPDHPYADHHGHEGPHGGRIIELGRKHEYHAEIVENHETEIVTVYLLDDAMNPLAVRCEQITFYLTINGQPQSFQLVAVDPVDGRSCRFDSVDTSLLRALERTSEVKGKLRVTIAGKPFVGRVAYVAYIRHLSL